MPEVLAEPTLAEPRWLTLLLLHGWSSSFTVTSMVRYGMTFEIPHTRQFKNCALKYRQPSMNSWPTHHDSASDLLHRWRVSLEILTRNNTDSTNTLTDVSVSAPSFGGLRSCILRSHSLWYQTRWLCRHVRGLHRPPGASNSICVKDQLA